MICSIFCINTFIYIYIHTQNQLSMSISDNIQNQIIISCPHCNECIVIEELNCCIFRHGVFKSSGEQMPPHSSKPECDEYTERGLIYGCGKPFKIMINQNNTYIVEICDYV